MRVVVTSLFFIAFAGAAAAQDGPAQSPGVLDQVYACAHITDEAQRLACYDGAVGRLREAQTSGQIVAVDREQVAMIERESFGFSLPSLPRIFNMNDGAEREQIEEQRMEIARIETRQHRNILVHMTNGQVWEVTGGGSNRNARAGAQVSIRRGAVGGFLMYVDAGGAAWRVQRRS